MLSNNLLKELQERKMSYIVAARLASSSEEVVGQVCKRIVKKDGRTVRVDSPHGDMVCSYSSKRYRKDKVMHEKDIAKAKLLIGKGELGRRAKFIIPFGSRNASEDVKLFFGQAIQKIVA